MSSSDAGEIAVIILAAGQGTRMRSSRAKVLHEICGRPMLGHVLASASAHEPERLLVVVGRDADEVRSTFEGQAEFVLQDEQRGTGHAVQVALRELDDFSGDVLILYGDTPLLRTETFRALMAHKRETRSDLVMLTARGPIPGRVVRDADGRVERIVEAQDASAEELAIEERNTGVYLVGSELLRAGIASLKDHNEQGELYVTDVVGFAVERGSPVEALLLPDGEECLGINTRSDLAAAARVMRRRIAEGHMAAGVTIVDPEQTYIDVDVRIGRDSVIDPGCQITGPSVIGERVHVKAHCVIESSRLDPGVEIGPMAHLRPNCHLKEDVKVGNFVEIKNSVLGAGSKSAHLSYIGDADVGSKVNFGCGTIVVNYDGFEKHRTTVGDGVFIGCNANLVAPLRLNDHTFIAAGSTVTKEVPENALAVARARQTNLEGWVTKREQLAAQKKAAKAERAAKKDANR